MSEHAKKALALADKILVKAADALSDIEREMATWPADFSAIMWETIADVASRRAQACRQKEAKK